MNEIAQFVTAIVVALNQLSTGKFVALLIVGLPVMLVAMVLGVIIVCLAALAVIAAMVVFYEWLTSRILDIRIWLIKRSTRSRNR